MENSKTYGFKKNAFPFGTATPTDKVDFEFELIDGLTGDDIEWIEVSCDCSNVRWDEEENKVVGTLDIAKTGGYNQDATPVSRNFTVVYNDGKPRFVPGKGKVRTTNAGKAVQVLTIVGTVVPEPAEKEV